MPALVPAQLGWGRRGLLTTFGCVGGPRPHLRFAGHGAGLREVVRPRPAARPGLVGGFGPLRTVGGDPSDPRLALSAAPAALRRCLAPRLRGCLLRRRLRPAPRPHWPTPLTTTLLAWAPLCWRRLCAAPAGVAVVSAGAFFLAPGLPLERGGPLQPHLGLRRAPLQERPPEKSEQAGDDPLY